MSWRDTPSHPPPFPEGCWDRNACSALAWPKRGGCSTLDLGFLTPVQHPASSTFADASPSTWASPSSMQGQLTMGPYPPIPSQQYSGDHTLQKPSLVFSPSQISKSSPECLLAPSSTRCLPPAHALGAGSIPWAGRSVSPLPTVSPVSVDSCPSANRFFRFSWPLPVFRS